MKKRRSETTLNKKIQELEQQKRLLQNELKTRQSLESKETKELLGELLINAIERNTTSKKIINEITDGIQLGKKQRHLLIQSGLLTEPEAGCMEVHKKNAPPS